MTRENLENAVAIALKVYEDFYKKETDKKFMEMVKERVSLVDATTTILTRRELDYISSKLLLIIKTVKLHHPFIEEAEEFIRKNCGDVKMKYTLSGDLRVEKPLDKECVLKLSEYLVDRTVVERILFSIVVKIPESYIHYGVRTNNYYSNLFITIFSNMDEEKVRDIIEKYADLNKN
jgi:hypothetical protein